MGKVTVRVPATTANIGPGFDTLGCALSMYNVFSFEEIGDSIEISGCDKQYAGADNLAYQAYLYALDSANASHPKGIRISIGGDVPISRGLGSSSTLIVAGVCAANAIRKLGYTKNDILRICTSLEGHPDNVAPAILGGMVASLYKDSQVISLPYSVSPSVSFTALIPDFELSTEKARAILPENVKRLDAVYTVGCLAILLKAFETGNRPALSLALNDMLHQPYRGSMIKGYDDIKKLAIQCGFCGLVISGSGSTLLAVGGDDESNARLSELIKPLEGNWRLIPLSVDTEGAVVTEE